jgi:hypothetical protein
MSGLKRRLTRRRSAGPEGSEPTAAAPGPGTAPNQPPPEEAPTSLLSDPAAQQTQVQPAPFSAGQPVPGAPYSHLDPSQPPAQPTADLPPGLDPDELAAIPTTSARRGRLRKRVAFLRAARELLLRDLGGFVYEIHRTAGDHEHEAHRRLRATKLDRLSRVDAELHELELLLDDVRRNVVVSEPGVGGECPECGELFGSAAHYCSHCGLPLTESARRAFSRIVAAQPFAAEAPAPVAPPSDQSTQELPPLTAQPGTEFHWPPREEAAGGAATGGEAAAGEAAAGEAASGAATAGAATGGETAAGEAGGGAATAGGATGGETAAGEAAAGEAGGGAATGGAATGGAATGGAATGGEATGGADSAAAEDAKPADDAATWSDAPGSEDAPAAGDDAPTRSDAPATPDDAAPSGEVTPGDAAPSGEATPVKDAKPAGGENANGRHPAEDPITRVERGT